MFETVSMRMARHTCVILHLPLEEEADQDGQSVWHLPEEDLAALGHAPQLAAEQGERRAAGKDAVG